MILSDIAIQRPVFATVLSLLIIVFGVASLLGLPVREYPDIDSPIVSVTVNYSGAAPEVVDSQIVQVVETAISGVDGIRAINSRSRTGSARTTIEFETERDIDNAANDVRDAISRIVARLPEDADPPIVAKADADARPMMWLTMTSTSMAPEEMTDYARRVLVDRFSVLGGVAEVRIGGERRYAMRIWLDNLQMTAQGVVVADIEQALLANNVELPAGRIESPGRNIRVRADSRLSTPEEFAKLVIRQSDDIPVRLGDIARVELGIENRDSRLRANGETAIGLGIVRQSRANTVSVSDRVQQQLLELKPVLPDGLAIAVNYDESVFIRASIREVLKTLAIALMLVILVIFVFLRSIRATLIPAFTIPVSVIGAFSLLALAGFSINVLTLLALILAIGLVVDDAIVMLENIQRRMDEGEPRLLAAWHGARQVTFAIIATTLTLISVFLPISFMGGNVGRLFSEFGYTLAAAVIVSSLVALSLAPMLCSRWLTPSKTTRHGQLWRITSNALESLNRGYQLLLDRALAAPAIVLSMALAVTLLSFAIFPLLPRELAPIEDRGVFIIPATAPQGSSADYTDHHVLKVEKALEPLVESGNILRVLSIVGFRGQEDSGFTIVRLKPWEDRERTQQSMVADMIPALASIPGIRAFPVNPPGLGQSGFSRPVAFVIGGPDYASVQAWSEQIAERAQQNPSLLNVDTDFELTQPQLDVQLDRQRAADLGISAQDVGRTLQTFLAGRNVTRFQDRGREYEVMLQAYDDQRSTPEALASIFLRTRDTGALVPLSALARVQEKGAAPELRRIDRLPAVTLNASLAPDYDLGQALDYLNSLAVDLPAEARISYSGLSREFMDASAAVYLTFLLALLVVFLVLAAQFESWIHPAIILLTVPLAATGALLSLHLTGISLNVYSQIGMIMLLGLMAKNGILVVEFANQLRAQGHSIADAIREGAILRFRPVIMTTISTIFGAVPLLLASGAGAESRAAIGVVIVGGLLLASTLTLFVIPVLYNLLARFTRPVNAVAAELETP